MGLWDVELFYPDDPSKKLASFSSEKIDNLVTKINEVLEKEGYTKSLVTLSQLRRIASPAEKERRPRMNERKGSWIHLTKYYGYQLKKNKESSEESP